MDNKTMECPVTGLVVDTSDLGAVLAHIAELDGVAKQHNDHLMQVRSIRAQLAGVVVEATKRPEKGSTARLVAAGRVAKVEFPPPSFDQTTLKALLARQAPGVDRYLRVERVAVNMVAWRQAQNTTFDDAEGETVAAINAAAEATTPRVTIEASRD